jgi:hypothetical protein
MPQKVVQIFGVTRCMINTCALAMGKVGIYVAGKINPARNGMTRLMAQANLATIHTTKAPVSKKNQIMNVLRNVWT